MTDRINALTVVLEDDIREDDAMYLVIAIKQLRGVLNVKKHQANTAELVAEQRVKAEIREKLAELIE